MENRIQKAIRLFLVTKSPPAINMNLTTVHRLNP
jgi:hypothetical protein